MNGSSPKNMESVKATIDRLIKSKALFVISKSYCPYCKMARDVLKVGTHYTTTLHYTTQPQGEPPPATVG